MADVTLSGSTFLVSQVISTCWESLPLVVGTPLDGHQFHLQPKKPPPLREALPALPTQWCLGCPMPAVSQVGPLSHVLSQPEECLLFLWQHRPPVTSMSGIGYVSSGDIHQGSRALGWVGLRIVGWFGVLAYCAMAVPSLMGGLLGLPGPCGWAAEIG